MYNHTFYLSKTSRNYAVFVNKQCWPRTAGSRTTYKVDHKEKGVGVRPHPLTNIHKNYYIVTELGSPEDIQFPTFHSDWNVNYQTGSREVCQQKSKVSRHTQCTHIQGIWFKIEAPNNWFKIFSFIHLYLKILPATTIYFIGKFHSILHRKTPVISATTNPNLHRKES